MSKTITKAGIARSVHNRFRIPPKESAELPENLIEIIKRTLASGEDVLASGFGMFCVKDKKERKGRNTATGYELILSSRKVVTFKCFGRLRDLINRNNKI
jgi:integration host factor subunit alpha